MVALNNVYSINSLLVTKLVDFAIEQDSEDVAADRVLDRDGKGLDSGEGAVRKQRDERLAARVGEEDLGRGRALDLVVVAVDEGALEAEELSGEERRVVEGALVFPRAGVQGEHELGVGGIDEVHAAEGPAVGVVGGSEAEEVGLVHQHRVLDVGGLFEGGEGGEVAALVVGFGLGDDLGEEIDLFTRRHVLCGLDSVWIRVAFIAMGKKNSREYGNKKK